MEILTKLTVDMGDIKEQLGKYGDDMKQLKKENQSLNVKIEN